MALAEHDLPNLRPDVLEPAVLEQIKDVYSQTDLFRDAIEQARHKDGADEKALRTQERLVDKQTVETRQKLERYFAAFESGDMDPKVCGERLGALQEELQQLQQESTRLDQLVNDQSALQIEADELQAIISRLEEVFTAGPFPKKKHLLRLLIKQTAVDDRRRARVTYRLPPVCKRKALAPR